MAEGSREKLYDTDEDAVHRCGQEVTLSTICLKITSIENTLELMRIAQERYVTDMAAHNLYTAKYPNPGDVWKADQMLRKHDTYFKIFGAAMVAAWGIILFILDKTIIWNK